MRASFKPKSLFSPVQTLRRPFGLFHRVEMLRTLLLALGTSAAAWQRLPPRCSRLRQAVRLHMAAPPLPEEGQEIEVECLRIAYGGQGIARTDTGATVMLTRAVPGEKLRAVVTRRRRRHVEARTTSVLAAGPASVTPPWSPLFATCGGCQLQHMAYDAQLATKRQWVVDAIARSPGGAALPPCHLLPSSGACAVPCLGVSGPCRGSHSGRTLPRLRCGGGTRLYRSSCAGVRLKRDAGGAGGRGARVSGGRNGGLA